VKVSGGYKLINAVEHTADGLVLQQLFDPVVLDGTSGVAGVTMGVAASGDNIDDNDGAAVLG
jgi:hypothetical protein